MDRTHAAYATYMLVFLLLCGSALIVPFLAFSQDMGWAYGAFGPTCHQKLSRSLCVWGGDAGYWIADCTAQGAGYVSDYLDRKEVRVEGDGSAGYKMPICARDFGIYAAMLLAGAAYPFVRRLDSRTMYPAIYLLLAMVPIALDGGLQLATEIDKPLLGSDLIPFEYESTNAMRLLSGAIAGFAASFYAIPVLVNIFSPEYDYPAASAKRAVQDAPAHAKKRKEPAPLMRE
ncbi:DUF2085 domain-containing protein [Candidatus Micrarchaeota archaeon]|nr:DUF2085 domain-containing protein [Candidatus Micrarchaeota archaeon]